MLQVTSLSQVTIGRISIGHIVNLASNDVQRFDLVSTCLQMFVTLSRFAIFWRRCRPSFFFFLCVCVCGGGMVEYTMIFNAYFFYAYYNTSNKTGA